MHKLFSTVVLFFIISLLTCPPLVAQSNPDFAIAEKYEVMNGFLLYDKDYAALAIQYNNEDLAIISDYCSYPAVKPDKNTFAFLEPWGFEETSKLLFYDITTRKTKAIEIPEITENNTAKEIVWLDNRLLLIIAGFDAGGDDYITKPIRPKVLVSRIRALLKRYEKQPIQKESQPAAPTITIDRERFVVFQNGREVILPKKEFDLLALLYSKPEKVFLREDIYNMVWGHDIVVGERTIDVHIRKLREKLGDKHIKTVKGVGYKFVP